jgi:hypothetical protein
MTSPESAATAEPEPAFTAIAMIDDGLRPMKFDYIPEADRGDVLALLSDEEVLEDLAVRGLDAAAVQAEPDNAIDSLTLPGMDNGMAFAKISDASEATQQMLERRQMMRQIAAAIRSTGKCEVQELGPEDDLVGIARFDVVFIDYYLDDKVADGTRAEQIASQVQDLRDPERRQQIVLMSTMEGVRAMRTEFRRNAKIEAASFAFVAKSDLDEDWKVKAHLEMLARGMQHAAALGDYISAVKSSAEAAAKQLSETIDDLDIGDFAYIQRIALHADGHPLGDYLSWLLSSHLTALAFEGALRKEQAFVDAMEFEDGPLSPSEPSVGVASLYHNALFARNLGPLGGHPRAKSESTIADVPFVQLGDVFLTADKARAVVILSPDCDLAFSTDPKRPPDRDLGVILVFGDPNSVASDTDTDVNSTTEGLVEGAEVYRIDWRFNSFRTVALGELTTFLTGAGFDVSKRDRLRPIYSLKLQHELGSHLTRVGPPIMPPIAQHAKAKIRYKIAEKVENVILSTGEVVVSRFKKKATVRFTPSLVAKLKLACQDVLDDLRATLDAMPTEGEGAQKALKPMAAKVEGLDGQLSRSDFWSGLLGDHQLPGFGECAKLKGVLSLALGGDWTFPGPPAVVLVIGEKETDDPLSGEGGQGERSAVIAAAAELADIPADELVNLPADMQIVTESENVTHPQPGNDGSAKTAAPKKKAKKGDA